MAIFIKKNGQEIETNDLDETLKAAVRLGWKLKDTSTETETETETDFNVDTADLGQLKAKAKELGLTMAANIGLETARTKVKEALQ